MTARTEGRAEDVIYSTVAVVTSGDASQVQGRLLNWSYEELTGARHGLLAKGPPPRPHSNGISSYTHTPSTPRPTAHAPKYTQASPKRLHDTAIANLVWCMTSTGRVEGRSYIAQKSRIRIAVVWVMQMGGGNKAIVDSCTHTNE